jgi:hypothetical protein
MCIINFTPDTIFFYTFDEENTYIWTSVNWPTGEGIIPPTYDDIKDFSYTIDNNRFMFYMKARPTGPPSGWWSIEKIANASFNFDVKYGIKFSPGPKVPIHPFRLLGIHYNKSAKKFTFDLRDDERFIDPNVLTEEDVGRTISFNFENNPDEENPGVYWGEVVIDSVENGQITGATATELSTRVEPAWEDYVTANWMISAFTGSDTYGGRLGAPTDMVAYGGRLILVKNDYVIGSSRNTSKFTFIMGDKDDDAIVTSVSTGEAGNILWIAAYEKLILGMEQGIYVIGDKSIYTEPITARSFPSNLITSIPVSKLKPVITSDSLIFIDSTKHGVYEVISPETSLNSYHVLQINDKSEDLVRTGVIDHAFQYYPHKIYWCVTNDGGLVGASLEPADPVTGKRTYRWFDCVMGGYNPYVMQIENCHINDRDVLFMIVKREIDNQNVYSVEYMSPYFDPIIQNKIEQVFLDAATVYSEKVDIKDIKNGTKTSVTLRISHGNIIDVSTFMNLKRGKLIILYKEEGEIKSIFYDKLNYSNITYDEESLLLRFDIDLITGTISDEHEVMLSDARYAFQSSIIVKKIENAPSDFVDHAVKITVNDTTPFQISGEDTKVFIVLSNSGFDELDKKFFLPLNVSRDSFLLSNENGELINLELHGLLNLDCTTFIGNDVSATEVTIKSPTVTLAKNMFDEDPEDLPPEVITSYHLCKFMYVYGADKYNDLDFYLRLISVDLTTGYATYKIYWSYNVFIPDTDNKFRLVELAWDYGQYDNLKEKNGTCFFYFNEIQISLFSHLVGQSITYTLSGNWSAVQPFHLTPDQIREGKIVLDHPTVTLTIGLPYTAEMSPVALQGGSVFQTSDGLKGKTKSVIVYMYASLGGEFSSSLQDAENGNIYDIPYRTNVPGKKFDQPTELTTQAIELYLPPNAEIDQRTVYLKSDVPLNFAILNIIEDSTISDGP